MTNQDSRQDNNATDQQPIIVGRIGAPYGVKGWVKIISFTKPLDNIGSYKPWLIQQQRKWQEIEFEQIKPHGKTLVAKLPGVNDRNLAASYTNADIAIKREQLPELPDDEFYWQDLIGLKVIDQDNQELGVVDSMMETGANDVVVIRKGKQEQLIPFIMGDVIKEIDLDNKVIKVEWLAPV